MGRSQSTKKKQSLKAEASAAPRRKKRGRKALLLLLVSAGGGAYYLISQQGRSKSSAARPPAGAGFSTPPTSSNAPVAPVSTPVTEAVAPLAEPAAEVPSADWANTSSNLSNTDVNDSTIVGLAPAAEAPAVTDFGASAPASFASATTTPAPGGGVLPLPDGSAPEGYVIKGNADSGIYHVPTGRSYDQTVAEVWFASEEEAQLAGYRPAKA